MALSGIILSNAIGSGASQEEARTIVSKSHEMVDLTMALFARFRVNGKVSEIFTLDMIT